MKHKFPQIIFIVGSPRSGTTILENILNCHPAIAEWYEPYYLWETFFSCVEDDIWHEQDLTEEATIRIRKEFQLFGEKAGKPMVLDKSPLHSFNMNIIMKVFPDAKWIHILRDGRDATLSIRREWMKRKDIVENKSFKSLFRMGLSMLQRQPFWRYRLMAMGYEIRSNPSLNPIKSLNKARWQGAVGWGPRFAGWQACLDNCSPLEFNAMQWVKSVEAVQRSWLGLPESDKIEIRYETLLAEPEKTLIHIFDVLGLEAGNDFFESMPPLKRGNSHKWENGFSQAEKEEIKPILDPFLSALGYADQESW